MGKQLFYLTLIALLILAYPRTILAKELTWGGEFEAKIFANDKVGEAEAGSINSLTLLGDAVINPNVSFHSRLIFRYLSGYKILTDEEVTNVLIDRAQVNLYWPKFNLIVGKQRLAWGPAYAYNPTDVFNPPDFTDPRGERPGVNALRLNVPLKEVSELMVVAAQNSNVGFDFNNRTVIPAEKKIEDAEVALRFKTNWQGYDLAVIGIDLGKDASEKFGGSVNGELFGLGAWLEGTQTFPEYRGREKDEKVNYWQWVSGLDYTLPNGKVYLVGEYYRNNQGRWSYRDYQWERLRMGEISNLGMDYFFGLGRYSYTDLTRMTLSGLVNLNDSSFFYHPDISYDIYDDVLLSAGMYGFYGEEKDEFFGQKDSKNYRLYNEYLVTLTVNF